MLYHLSFFKRNRGKYESPIFIDSSDCELEYDAISNAQSNFKVTKQIIPATVGDFVLVKKFITGQMIYFGVVQSIEEDGFGACQICSLVDFEFAATRVSGKSFEQHFKNLITNNLINDETKNIPHLIIYTRTSTEHLYQPSDPPTSTNLMKYYFNAFKKYNIIWRFVDIDEDGNLVTELIRMETKVKLKDNNSDLFDWDVSIRKANSENENKLMIVNKNTSNSENPNILATYYLTKANEVTTDSKHSEIERPTVTKIYIYDTEQEDKPTYENVAKSELSGNAYSHEITVKIRSDSKLFPEEIRQLGLLVNLTIGNEVRESVLTYYSVSGEDIEVKFGNIRSRVSDYLDE